MTFGTEEFGERVFHVVNTSIPMEQSKYTALGNSYGPNVPGRSSSKYPVSSPEYLGLGFYCSATA